MVQTILLFASNGANFLVAKEALVFSMVKIAEGHPQKQLILKKVHF
jgi:hypothetical protein